MFRWLLLLAVLIAGAVGLAVGVLNPSSVVLDLAFFQPELPLGGLVLLVFAVGTLCGLLLYWVMFDLPARLKRRTTARTKPTTTGTPVTND
jgi:uncharacterized membrane protein YciS (DUF1049 family)